MWRPENREKESDIVKAAHASANAQRRFKPDAPLRRYIAGKSPEAAARETFSVNQVLAYLKDILEAERLYDPHNISILLCDEALEAAIDRKALHITELRARVCAQMEDDPPSVFLPPSDAPAPPYDANTQFGVKAPFLKVLHGLPESEVDRKKRIFTFVELKRHLGRYIRSREKKFFDARNIRVLMCKGDPLGDALGVRAFHVSQLSAMLSSQLIPLCIHGGIPVARPQLLPPGTQASNSSNGADDDASASAAKTAPRPPSSLGAADAATSRKRTTADAGGDEADGGGEAEKRRCLSPTTTTTSVSFPAAGGGTVSAQLSGDDGFSSRETMYSYQCYDTEPADGRDSSSTCSCCTDRHGYSSSSSRDDGEYTEFELDSEPEEEEETAAATPEAARRRSLEDSDDSDIHDVRLVSPMAPPESDSAATAACDAVEKAEASSSGDSPSSEGPALRFKSLPCLTCGTPENTLVRYCIKCWKGRKGWLPPRPARRRRRSRRTAPSKKEEEEGGDVKKKEEEEAVPEASTSERARNEEKMECDRCDAAGAPAEPPACDFCMSRPRDAGIVHGRIIHNVCCYPCAKKLVKERKPCPVCRRRMEKIARIM